MLEPTEALDLSKTKRASSARASPSKHVPFQPSTALPGPLKSSLLAMSPSAPPKEPLVPSSKVTAYYYGTVAWRTLLQWRTGDLVLASNPGANLIRVISLPCCSEQD